MGRNEGGNASKKVFVAVAVDNLCKHRSLDSLSIVEICEGAHVSRSGFYRLFQDKYDIARWCQIYPLEQGVGQMGRTLTCAQGIEVTFEGLCLFRHLFKSAKKSHGFVRHDEIGRKIAYESMKRTLEEFHGVEVDRQLDFDLIWCTDASTDISRRWITGNYEATPQEMGELISAAYPSRLRSYFDAPIDPQPKDSFDLSTFLMMAMADMETNGQSL